MVTGQFRAFQLRPPNSETPNSDPLPIQAPQFSPPIQPPNSDPFRFRPPNSDSPSQYTKILLEN